jgi:transposase
MLRQQRLKPIPENTVRAVRACFKKGHPYIAFADSFADLFEYHEFSELFSNLGQSAYSPVQLSLMTLLQFAEGLSDRQACEAASANILWKYLLHMDVEEASVDASVLSEFRQRLQLGGQERLLFDKLLHAAEEKGLLKTKKQRTDATHVLAVARDLTQLELVTETMRNALDAIAVAEPDWLRETAPQEWYVRYGERAFNYKLPKTDKAREELGQRIGADGKFLLKKIEEEQGWLGELPEVLILKQVFEEQFEEGKKGPRLRGPKDQRNGAERVGSPHDVDARNAAKRGKGWFGYKVHITETCEEGGPYLITNVETTAATTNDAVVLPQIHESLRERGFKPEEHLVDGGYFNADVMVRSLETHAIKVISRASQDTSWQAREGKGFEAANFSVDWVNERVVCPSGVMSSSWRERPNRHAIEVKFPESVCAGCKSRADCTKSERQPRKLEIKTQAAFEYLRKARVEEQTDEFKRAYAQRAGIEGTHSQAVRRSKARRSRYVGLAKTHMQNLLTAAALNLIRLGRWLTHRPLAQTRATRFAKLAVS